MKKHTIEKLFIAGVIACALLGALLPQIIKLSVYEAQAQVTPNSQGSVTGLPSVIEKSGTSNILFVIDCRQGKTLAWSPYFGRTNAGTDDVVFAWDVSVDGTNYSTTTINTTNTGNGTTGVRAFNMILPTVVNGAQKIRLKTIGNADSGDSIWITNIVYGWSQ